MTDSFPGDWPKVVWRGATVPAMMRPMPGGSLPIAVLDDEAGFRQALARLLKVNGFAAELFANGHDLLAALARQPYHCLLLDLHMPGLAGFDVLTVIQERKLRLPVIVITGYDQPGTKERAQVLGAADYLLKPLDETALLAALAAASDHTAS